MSDNHDLVIKKRRRRIYCAVILIFTIVMGVVVFVVLWFCVPFGGHASNDGPETACDLSDKTESARCWMDHHAQILEAKRAPTMDAIFEYVTNMTPETEQRKNALSEDFYATETAAANDIARRFNLSDIRDGVLCRSIEMLLRERKASTPNERKALAKLKGEMEKALPDAMVCPPNKGTDCRDKINSNKVKQLMRNSHNETELKTLWKRYMKAAARPIKQQFFPFVDKMSEQARRLGFSSISDRWISDISDGEQDMRGQIDRLFYELVPFYEDLHTFVRYKLNQHYGDTVVGLNGTIPSHILGDVNAQIWDSLLDIVAANALSGSGDSHDHGSLSSKMKELNWTPRKIYEVAEDFFVGIGFTQLSQTFWERSVFSKPPGRKMDCHAVTYDIARGDKRMKHCAVVDDFNMLTAHHELGHIYNYIAYEDQPYWFRGTNPAVFEAIGNAVYLSVDSEVYHKHLGLLPHVHESVESDIKRLLKKALLLFPAVSYAYTLDHWRFAIFDGKISEAEANSRFWELRQKLQGIHAPVPRTEDDFDAAAKFHVPQFIAQTRYFFAFLNQFQFHKALCGTTDDLSKCSIFNNKEAGRRLWDLLKVGRSVPWTESLKKLTGYDSINASPLMNYFKTLGVWLREQNKKNGLCIGWGASWPSHVRVSQPRCRPRLR